MGTLDPSGRWYASALRDNRLAILDLDRGTCHEFDAMPTTNSSDLEAIRIPSVIVGFVLVGHELRLVAG
ncbi:hypothetical protein K1Y78_48385 [Streptomyces sp. tea 10]|nr:hypothetical protein [Streptomyces sp. tea 10]